MCSFQWLAANLQFCMNCNISLPPPHVSIQQQSLISAANRVRCSLHKLPNVCVDQGAHLSWSFLVGQHASDEIFLVQKCNWVCHRSKESQREELNNLISANSDVPFRLHFWWLASRTIQKISIQLWYCRNTWETTLRTQHMSNRAAVV